MFCPKCGNQLSDGSAFCPKCGERIAATQGNGTSTNVGVGNNTPKMPNNKLRNIIIAVAAALVLIVIVASIVSGGSSSAWVKENSGKGADDPIGLAKELLVALNDRNMSPMEKYWDAWSAENYMSFDDYSASTYSKMSEEMTDNGNSPLYLEGTKYELVDDGSSSNDNEATVKVWVSNRGMFGGESITKPSWELTLEVHKNETPDGEKWFLGPYATAADYE